MPKEAHNVYSDTLAYANVYFCSILPPSMPGGGTQVQRGAAP